MIVILQKEDVLARSHRIIDYGVIIRKYEEPIVTQRTVGDYATIKRIRLAGIGLFIEALYF